MRRLRSYQNAKILHLICILKLIQMEIGKINVYFENQDKNKVITDEITTKKVELTTIKDKIVCEEIKKNELDAKKLILENIVANILKLCKEKTDYENNIKLYTS